MEPDLDGLSEGYGWKAVRRVVSPLLEKDKRGVRLDEAEKQGIAWFEGSTFSDGTIECDLRGKDVLQKSFLGIAFHGVDENTHWPCSATRSLL